MNFITAKSIENRMYGSSRDIGRMLASSVAPGDTIDFTGFTTVNNSFADEFIWKFLKQHSSDAISTLNFTGETSLMRRLLQRAINRRACNARIITSSNPKIHRGSVDFLSELAG